MALRKVGISCCEALPVVAFAVPPNSEKNLAGIYSDRLMQQFRGPGRLSRRSRRGTRPVTIISGADDELMFADKYAVPRVADFPLSTSS